ncbi:MAG: hypothetical protein MJ177_09975 [Clostridia bacterium]|nr:hypothetical protein [Clostridia bacterium]
MTDDIKAWALTVCISAVMSGIVMQLVPDNSTKRCLGALCAVLTAAMLLLPVGGKISSEGLLNGEYTFDENEAQRQLDEEVTGYVKKQLCESFTAEAEQLDIKITDMDMELDITNVSDVRVSKIIIGDSLSEKEKQAVSALAQSLYESVVTVIFEGG